MAEEEREWQLRPDIDAVVTYAVERWHQHLERAHIVGVGRPQATKKHGKNVWASLKKPSALEQVLYEDSGGHVDYLVIVALDVWEQLGPEHRRALIDHELSHAGGLDLERDEWTLVTHDIEEFANVVRRHGAWRDDVQHFLEATKGVDPAQGILPLAEGDAGLLERLRPTQGGTSLTVSAGGKSVTLHKDGRTERTGEPGPAGDCR